MPDVMTAAALCAVGAEKAVSNEIRKLGLEICESGFGRVRFKTDGQGLYKTLIGLRAADRVLLETAWFKAEDFDALFDGTKSVPWETFIPKGSGLAVAKVRTNRSTLMAETSIQAIVHKAAAERLCKKWGVLRLPDTEEKAELRVYIEKNNVSLLLDLSGEPLFKRGYRTEGGIAPLRETTAAALILLSGWKRKFPLHDPFCGSGTIAAEAAMYAWDMAPGLNRGFAIDRLLLSDKKTEKYVRDEFLEHIDFTRLVRISGSDSDAKSVRLSKTNIEKIYAAVRGRGKGEPTLPHFEVMPMKDATALACGATAAGSANTDEGYIITNPPYGRRLGSQEDSEEIYKDMGGLAQMFPGWRLVVITDHSGFESFFGKKADSCREITNGAIQSYMYQYERL
ncbi:MAG: class I SAM-dependent RNA methyltransferase [Treponema sp.]|nr:class I SAM-dependent RNA methyltransferase [Treponema sp.]